MSTWNTYPSFFPLNFFALFCFVFFYYCHHSLTNNREFWFNVPWGIISSFFYKHLPLHSSLHSNSLLWSSGFGTKCWRHSTESWENKMRGWEAVVISRRSVWNTGPVWAAEVATHTMPQFLVSRLSLSPGGALVGSCIVTLNILIPPCCLVGIPKLKDVPNELFWSKAMSMPFKDYLMHLRMLTPPSLRHIQYWHRLLSILILCSAARI